MGIGNGDFRNSWQLVFKNLEWQVGRDTDYCSENGQNSSIALCL